MKSLWHLCKAKKCKHVCSPKFCMLSSSNALGKMPLSQEHLKTMVYFLFLGGGGAQTECIMGDSTIVSEFKYPPCVFILGPTTRKCEDWNENFMK